MHLSRRLGLCLAAFFAWTAAAAAAEEPDCALKQVASFDMVDANESKVLVPIKLNGQDTLAILDTGAFWSGVRPLLVHGQLGKFSPVGSIDVTGQESHGYVTVRSVQLAGWIFSDVDFFLWAQYFDGMDERIGANLGANILRSFDVEIDPAHRKVEFFVPHACKGGVYHWPHGDASVMPLHFDHHLISLRVKLDGKEIDAGIDTGAAASVLTEDAAKDLFGVTPDTPGVQKMGCLQPGQSCRQTYRYQFKSLDLGDVSFGHPWIEFGPFALGGKEMLLGWHQLRQLHLYFAYKEGMLYASSIAGDDQAAGGAPPGVAAPESRSWAATPSGDAVDRANAIAATGDAFDHLRRHEIDAAIASFGEVILKYPNVSALYVWRGILEEGTKAEDAAKQDFDKASSLSADRASALEERCQLRSTMGEQAQALADCDEALRLAPDNLHYAMSRSIVELELGQWDAALADFDRLVRIDPKDAGALYGRGVARLRKGDADGQKDLDSASRIAPAMATEFSKAGIKP